MYSCMTAIRLGCKAVYIKFQFLWKYGEGGMTRLKRIASMRFFQKLHCPLGALLVWIGCGLCSDTQASDVRILFIGNSYTYGNDLEQLTARWLQRVPLWNNVYAQRAAPGGYRMEQHTKDADGTRGTTQLREWLVSSQDPQHKWSYGILQEQSQIPGFAQSERFWQASLQGIKTLHSLLHKRGAKTFLLMTWGRRAGDAQNPVLYKDFKTMQMRLSSGYRAFAKQASTKQAPVFIAPVGIAFEKIYDDSVHSTGKPLEPSSLFYRLYTSDGSHPSVLGSYLASCVLFAAISGRDPSLHPWAPSSISVPEQKQLQAAARFAVIERAFDLDPFPWTYDWNVYPWSSSTSKSKRVLSGISVVPMIRIHQKVDAIDSMRVGVEHKGEHGSGRIWVTVKGIIMVRKSWIHGDSGRGFLYIKGGSLQIQEMLWAETPTSFAMVSLESGRLAVQRLEVGKGTVQWSMKGGQLAFSQWNTSLHVQGGVLQVGLTPDWKDGVGASNVKGKLHLGKDAQIHMQVTHSGKQLVFDQLHVTQEAQLNGEIRLDTSAIQRHLVDREVELLTARKMVLGRAFKIQSSHAHTYRIVPLSDGRFALRVRWIHASQETSKEKTMESIIEPFREQMQDGGGLEKREQREGKTQPERPTRSDDTIFEQDSVRDVPKGSGQGCCQIGDTQNEELSLLWMCLLCALCMRLKRATRRSE